MDATAPLPPPALDRPDDALAGRRGRWHGLVYIEVPRSRRLAEAASKATGRPARELCRDAHVSLSRPFGLYRHEVEPFLARLRRELAGRCCRPFLLRIDAAAEPLELPSYDGARAFRCLPAAAPALGGLADAVDDALEAFGREPYFPGERKFHVSVGETGGRRSRSRSRSPAASDSSDYDSDSDDGGGLDVDVDAVVVKYGHKRAEISLEPLPS